MSNVTPLFEFNTLAPTRQDVALVLRQLAGYIELGSWPDISNVIVLIRCDGGERKTYAIGQPMNVMELVGLLQWFQHDIIHPENP